MIMFPYENLLGFAFTEVRGKHRPTAHHRLNRSSRDLERYESHLGTRPPRTRKPIKRAG